DKVDAKFHLLREEGFIQGCEETKTHLQILTKYQTDLQESCKKPTISASDYSSIQYQLARLTFDEDTRYFHTSCAEAAAKTAAKEARQDAAQAQGELKEFQGQVNALRDENATLKDKTTNLGAQVAQTAQDIHDGYHRVQIGVETTLQISSTDDGGITISTSSTSNVYDNSDVYDKLYELKTIEGFKVYGLSSDGGNEISGVLIIKHGQVVCFGSSLEEEGHRYVRNFIKEGDAWLETAYDTNNPQYDTPNDDGVLSEQQFAQFLNLALNQKVASEEQCHIWQRSDQESYSVVTGSRQKTIFQNAATVTGDAVLNNVNGIGVTNPVAYTVADGKSININPTTR
ncbi:MAG: hypothetical protein EBT55_04665, partial [Proteobacteria bacterium]|nr:hypothetical protein [Pseudomonadota bacterium]